MPTIREMAWEWRGNGEVEILQRGEVLSLDVGLEDVRGPIRLRRVQQVENENEREMG